MDLTCAKRKKREKYFQNTLIYLLRKRGGIDPVSGKMSFLFFL